jgi:GNAT superfamily N-acetyltransferase
MDQALIERLLTAATVEIAIIDPARAEARHCIHSYFAELDRRFDTGFDPSRTISADDVELRLPAGLLVVAWLQGRPVGCGGLKFHGDQPAELKRMWVSDTARGLGIGRRLLTDLEQLAVKHGARTVRLETNGTLTEAISLYRYAGYVEVPAFNDEPYAHHWFEKRLSDYAHSTSPNRA